MLLTPQTYDLRLQYVPGSSDIVLDDLSRYPQLPYRPRVEIIPPGLTKGNSYPVSLQGRSVIAGPFGDGIYRWVYGIEGLSGAGYFLHCPELDKTVLDWLGSQSFHPGLLHRLLEIEVCRQGAADLARAGRVKEAEAALDTARSLLYTP